MKIKISIEDKGKIVKIPLTEKEIRNVYDMFYLIDNKELKLNKIKLPIKKFQFLVHDIIDKGKAYSFDKKTNRFILNKKPHYIIKEPKHIKE